jgi:hypothetical protein
VDRGLVDALDFSLQVNMADRQRGILRADFWVGGGRDEEKTSILGSFPYICIDRICRRVARAKYDITENKNAGGGKSKHFNIRASVPSYALENFEVHHRPFRFSHRFTPWQRRRLTQANTNSRPRFVPVFVSISLPAKPRMKWLVWRGSLSRSPWKHFHVNPEFFMSQ